MLQLLTKALVKLHFESAGRAKQQSPIPSGQQACLAVVPRCRLDLSATSTFAPVCQGGDRHEDKGKLSLPVPPFDF